MSFEEGGIDIWLIHYHDFNDEIMLAELRGLLQDSEREQEPRFYFSDDRKRYLVTRAMVRTLLSRYASVAPQDWRFVKNAYGRPQIDRRHTEALNLRFNISHTRGLIAIGIVRHREIGLDVENTRTRATSMEIADRFFSPTEAAELARMPEVKRQDGFFEYWTFKESYIKARGMGLSLSLEKFSFHYPNEREVQISIQPELGDAGERWLFWQYRPSPEHLLAVCAERMGDRIPKVVLRRAIPLAGDQIVSTELLKATACIRD